jgi:hypothetical protein
MEQEKNALNMLLYRLWFKPANNPIFQKKKSREEN